MKTILKVRLGTRRTRLVEVARRDSSGGGCGWRVDEHGIRWSTEKERPDGVIEETQELVMFTARDVACEMEEDRHYGGLKRKDGERQ